MHRSIATDVDRPLTAIASDHNDSEAAGKPDQHVAERLRPATQRAGDTEAVPHQPVQRGGYVVSCLLVGVGQRRLVWLDSSNDAKQLHGATKLRVEAGHHRAVTAEGRPHRSRVEPRRPGWNSGRRFVELVRTAARPAHVARRRTGSTRPGVRHRRRVDTSRPVRQRAPPRSGAGEHGELADRPRAGNQVPSWTEAPRHHGSRQPHWRIRCARSQRPWRMSSSRIHQ